MDMVLAFVKEQWYLLVLLAVIISILQFMVWQAVTGPKAVRSAAVHRRAIKKADSGKGKQRISMAMAQDIGARSCQEDSGGFAGDGIRIDKKGVLAVLGDGMGGLAGGQDISRFLVQEALAIYEDLSDGDELSAGLSDILREINRQACRAFGKGKTQSGTTAILAHIYKQRLFWACAGDSHLYLLRAGRLCQLNEDHIYRNELYARYLKGLITKAQAQEDVQADRLTAYIGQEPLKKLDGSRRGLPLKEGDRVILCSDGIYKSLGEQELAKKGEEGNPSDACQGIIRAVKDKAFRKQDNMTIMIMKYEELTENHQKRKERA